MAAAPTLYTHTVFCEVTLLRQAGRRLRRQEWGTPLRGTLRITEMDRAVNSAKRNLLCIELWEAYGTTSRRGLATMFDPVLLPSPVDGLLIAGIEFESDRSNGLKIFEHRQVWLCKPVVEPEHRAAAMLRRENSH